MLKFETGKLSAKGVVAIPIKVRNLLGVEEGDKLEFEQLDDDVVVVRGIKRKSVWDAFGSLDIEFKEPLVDAKEIRDQYREGRITDDLHRQDD